MIKTQKFKQKPNYNFKDRATYYAGCIAFALNVWANDQALVANHCFCVLMPPQL
jgi:hypothetical protein